jgi:hypothetical protein
MFLAMPRLRHALALSLLGPLPLAAQSTDAGFRGVVVDSGGAPLSAAIVEILHQPSGRRFTTATDATGRFRVGLLPVGGPYRATARAIGFRPLRIEGLSLVLGEERDLRLVLPRSVAELAPLVATADQRVRRADRVGGSTRVDPGQLAALPSPNRNFADLANLSPWAGPQLSLSGQRYTATSYRLDGIESRNLLRAGEYNAGPFAVSFEAIREFEINTHVYDVSQGRQGGGQISAVTRSGTNTWHASAFSSYRSEALGAATDFQGRDRSARPFTTVQWGGALSGPIVRDRVHFFASLERQDGSLPLLVGLLDTPEAELAAGVSRDSVDRILSVLAQQYGTEAIGSQLGRLARAPTATSIFGRIDWSLSPKQVLTLRHSASSWSNPLSGGVDQPITLREARSDFSSTEHQALLALRSSLSAGQNELSLGLSRSARELVPVSPGVPRGFVQVRSTLPDGAVGNTTIQFGGNRLAPDVSKEWQLQLVDRAVVQRGPVGLTFGVDNSLARFSTLIAEAQTGLFVFPSIAALETQRPNRFARTIPLAGTSPVTSLTTLDLSAYAQAEWSPTEAVSLTAGIRWDGSGMLTTPARNSAAETTLGVRTDRRASDWVKISPRAQLTWHSPDGRQVARLGAGRFTTPLPAYSFHNQLLNTGLTLADIDLRGTSVPAPNFPGYRNDPASVPGIPTGLTPLPYLNLVSSSFATPSIWKASASYQREVFRWLTLTATGTAAWGRGGYHYLDANLRASPAFTLDNEGGRGVYVPAGTIVTTSGLTDVRNAVASPSFARILWLSSKGRSRQYGAMLEASIRPSNRYRLDLAYAWTDARDNSTFGCCLARTATTFTPIATDPRNLDLTWASSDLEIRHRLVLSGMAALPAGTTLAGRLIVSGGRPYSLVVDGDLNGDESNGNDLAFIFDRDDPSTPAEVAASLRRMLDNRANFARDYLRTHLGTLSGRNALRTPGYARLDLRLQKPIRLGNGLRAIAMVDLLNALNAIDSDWGAERVLPLGISVQNPVVNRVPLLRIVGFDPATNRYRYAVNEQAGVLSKGGDPYQFQIGIRFER